MGAGVDITELESAFVGVAKSYGRAKGHLVRIVA